MHTVTIDVECDGGPEEEPCEARFTLVQDDRPLRDLDVATMHQARQRGWTHTTDDRGRSRWVCPLHR